jgi:hypothetical protein
MPALTEGEGHMTEQLIMPFTFTLPAVSSVGDWDQVRPGAFSRAYCDDDSPIAIYTVTEITLKKGYVRYRADVLTEVGAYMLGDKFRTQKGAQEFCERTYKDWQRNQIEILRRAC